MSDLKLVPPDQPTPLEQLLLNAASNEAPSAEQRLRVRQALGLPAVALAPPPAVPVGRLGRHALFTKAAIGGLVVVSAALVLVFSGVGRSPAPVTPAPVVGAQPNAPAPAPATLAQPSLPTKLEATPATPAEPLAQPLPPIEVAPGPASARSGASPSSATSSAKGSVAARASSSSQTSADDGADLSEQLRLIEAARAAVASGNAAAASSAIASYRSRFPRGAFGQEAAVLQIETLDLQGNHTQAASLARNFLARHPNSPHVSVVQRIADR